MRQRWFSPQAFYFHFRKSVRWEAGQELIAIDMGDGILLKPKKPFSETKLEDVAGCLKYQGKPKSIDDLEDAI